MENKLKILFVLVLILTFVVVRMFAHFLHDGENYSDYAKYNNEKVRTFTSLLRQATGVNWHHIHFGIIIFITVIVLLFLGYVNVSSVIFLAISVSLILDQIVPLLDLGNYFSLPILIVAMLLHLIVIEIVLILINFS